MEIYWIQRLSSICGQVIFLTLLGFSIQNVECKYRFQQTKMLVSSNTLNAENFKPGVSINPQPDSIYYNKYIPLVFQLKAPDFSPESLKINSSLHCTTDTINPNYFCPVAYHFEKLLIPLAENMKFTKNIYLPLEGWPYFGEIDCEIIEPHFQHIAAHLNELPLYLNKLKSECPLAKNITVVTKNITSGASNHISMANNRFLSALDTNKDFNSDEYKLIHMSGYIGLQTSYILTKYIDTIRWSNAFTSCQSSKLNINLVHSYLLQTSLAQVKTIAEANGYKLAIPSHEHLPQYYKLPITDCILGIQNVKSTTLMIRVSVPVVKKESKYTRIRMIKIPYLITDTDEKGEQKKICEIDNFETNEEFLIEENLEGAHKPMITEVLDCMENELCFVPEQPRRIIVDPCLRGLINGSVDDIRDYCSFECYDVEHEHVVFPIIIKIDSNQYSITGSPSTYFKKNMMSMKLHVDKIQVFCDNVHNQDLNPNSTNGVMQVVLPCNCEIRYKSNVYKAYRPCSGPLAIHYLTTLPFEAVFLQALLNEEGKNETMEEVEGLATAADEAEMKREAADFHINSTCSSHSGELGFIWIFIVLLLLSNSLLIYVAFCNRLIHFDLLTGLLSRWGIGSTTPINRLSEEQQNNRNNLDNFSQPAWPTPASLNRL